MGKTVVWHDRVWSRITRRVEAVAGKRRAAVAFVGEQAPTLLPLRSGDLLYVNASDHALAMGSTNPKALRKFVNAGVDVRHAPDLHAKVILGGRTEIIDSANASAHSAGLIEAVTVTTDPDAVQAAAQLFELLADPTLHDQVDEVFLERADAKWRPPNAPPAHRTVRLLPGGDFRLMVFFTTEWEATFDDQRAWKAGRPAARARAGPAGQFDVNSLQLESKDRDAYTIDDVLVQTFEKNGELWAWPPVTVLSTRNLAGGGQLVFVSCAYRDAVG